MLVRKRSIDVWSVRFLLRFGRSDSAVAGPAECLRILPVRRRLEVVPPDLRRGQERSLEGNRVNLSQRSDAPDASDTDEDLYQAHAMECARRCNMTCTQKDKLFTQITFNAGQQGYGASIPVFHTGTPFFDEQAVYRMPLISDKREYLPGEAEFRRDPQIFLVAEEADGYIRDWKKADHTKSTMMQSCAANDYPRTPPPDSVTCGVGGASLVWGGGSKEKREKKVPYPIPPNFEKKPLADALKLIVPIPVAEQVVVSNMILEE